MMKNIHGHTKIELTNVNTGEVKTVEDNNMVTNAIELMLNAPYENMPNTANSSKLWNYLSTDPNTNVKNLTQGLILFQDAIIEDPNQIDPPAGNNVVGLGQADLNYNGSILEYGSYNSTESQLFPADNPKYVKYVWDFSTSQGNGVINCACLTTKQGGQMGYGVKSIDSSIAKWLATQYAVGDSIYGKYSNQNGLLIDSYSQQWTYCNNLQYLWVDLDKNDQYSYLTKSYIDLNHPYANLMAWNPYFKEWKTLQTETYGYHGGAEKNTILLRKGSLNKSHYELSNALNYTEETEDIEIEIPNELLTILEEARTNLLNSSPTGFAANDSWLCCYYSAYTSRLYITEKNLYIAFIPFSLDSQKVKTVSVSWNDVTAWQNNYNCLWLPGEKMYILKIEKNTWITSYEEIVNTTENTFRLPYAGAHDNKTFSWEHSAFFITDKNILLLENNATYLYNYNRAQKTFTKCVGKRNNQDIEIKADTDDLRVFYLEKEDRIFLYRNTWIDGGTGGLAPSYYARIIELSNSTISYHNYHNSKFLLNMPNMYWKNHQDEAQWVHSAPIPVYKHSYFNACFIGGSNITNVTNYRPQIISFFHVGNPMLMTINNLPEPVEKTKEYTMKVTYELTWD